MKKLTSIILLIGLMSMAEASSAFTPLREIGDVGSWHYLFATWKATDNWTTHFYIDMEKKPNEDKYGPDENGQLWNFRFRRYLDEDKRFKIGLNYGQYHVTGGVSHQRPELSLFYCEKFDGFSINHRSRIESWIKEGTDEFKWRYRHMWSFDYKVNKQVGVGFAEEIMTRTKYNVEPMPWDQEWDTYQNWLDPFYVSYKINHMHKFKFYYRFYTKEDTMGELFNLSNAQQYFGLAYFINFK